MIAITDGQLLTFARLAVMAGARAQGLTMTAAAIEQRAASVAAGAGFRAVVEAAAHYGWQNAAPTREVKVRKGARAVIAGQMHIGDIEIEGVEPPPGTVVFYNAA